MRLFILCAACLYFLSVMAISVYASPPWLYGKPGKHGKNNKDFSIHDLKKFNPIRIKTLRELNFGTAMKPESGRVKIVVTKRGAIGGGTTATMLDTGAVSEGANKIKGSKKNTIQIALYQCGSNSRLGIKIKKFKAKYGKVNFTNTGVALDPPGKKGKKLIYGATMVISSSAPIGQLSPCYDVVVNYE